MEFIIIIIIIIIIYPPGTGRPSYTPRHWVPFSSPPKTRRAGVEVFEHASTRGYAQALWESLYIYIRGANHTENTVLLQEPLRNLAVDHREPRSYCCPVRMT
jgi:hypothetical protein